MPVPQTIAELLTVGASDAVAIGTPDAGQPLTYAGLRANVSRAIGQMRGAGISRNDRVAIVLPNGPTMAVAFLSVAAGASACPLNPGYREEEFDFFLSDLSAKALIVEAGSQSPAIKVARERSVRVLELTPSSEGSGAFRFGTDTGSQPGAVPDDVDPVRPEDVALILHTSGTTSRPKVVPLTQRNVCTSAAHIVDTLRLTSGDRSLNIMPLFHIHGLMAGLLAPMAAGSAVFCPPGFNPIHFFLWMAACRPTWFTAVPAMHQMILARAAHNQQVIKDNPLRFIRSSSAAMPRKVIADLEAAFNAPLIESYGMTEASHQMASNPLPPEPRKPGTVGKAAGPEVAIMDAAGNLLPAGQIGEIVIRGPNVTSGYENNAKANAEAFTNDWFRTGDQGVMDPDGYVAITGRFKEIINKGGDKISPREVDEVLSEHPAVAQVVVFAVPHALLGEDVAAVVVLREGAKATESELRAFASLRIADFKVPRKIVFVDDIPKGPTGKLQRIGLAGRLGLA